VFQYKASVAILAQARARATMASSQTSPSDVGDDVHCSSSSEDSIVADSHQDKASKAVAWSEHSTSRKRWRRSAEYRPGPCSLEEVLATWPSEVLSCLASAGMLEEYHNKLSKLAVHSSFSGQGCPEQALAMLRNADRRDCPAPILHRCCDIAPTCRSILQAFPDHHKCRHIMQDLLHHVPKASIDNMTYLLSCARAEVQGRTQAGQDKRQCFDSVCERVLADLRAVLKDVDLDNPRTPCDCHHGDGCPWWNEEAELSLEVAGTICVAWSLMGAKQGWLSNTCIPFFIWFELVIRRQPDIVVHECTPRFAWQFFEREVGHIYHVQTALLSPTDFGIPSARERRWTLLLKTSSVVPTKSLDSEEFRQMFFRKVMVPGSIYFDAVPAKEMAVYIKELAAARGQPPQNAHGMPWTMREVLPPGHATRLLEWESQAKAKGLSLAMFDIEQHFSHTGSFSSVWPTMLRNSTIASVEGKVAAPLGHFAPLGIDLFGEACLIPLDFAKTLSSRVLKSVCGNAMHLAVVGTVLAWTLGSTRLARELRITPVLSMASPSQDVGSDDDDG